MEAAAASRYEGEVTAPDASVDPILRIDAERLPGDRYVLAWTTEMFPGSVSVFAGPSPDAIDLARPIVRDARSGLTIEAPHSPCYFALRAEGRPPIVVGARHLALEGATNLRDLGGYATGDGRRVQWGRLFRSGHLARLSERSQQNLAELGIRTVCDFRIDEERTIESMVLPHGPELIALDIPPGLKDRLYFQRLFERTDDPREVTAAIQTMLRGLVLESSDRYRTMFDALLDARGGALLFHCSAGKERTGTGMVFVLTALGVPRDTIRHDFLLSKRYFPAEREVPRILRKYAVPSKTDAQLRPLIEPMLDTAPSYVEAIFSAIDECADSPERFLEDRLGVTPERRLRLRDRYLAP